MTKMTIDLPVDIKNQVKASAAIMGQKMKDYVILALQEKMAKDKTENKYLGEIATRADREGYVGVKESSDLLNEMKNL
jgi:hypothetical protein